MDQFLHFIPSAAASPYAFGAYAVSAALFFLVGAKLKTVRSVLKVIDHVPESDRRHTIESITNSVIPDHISADEWIRSNRNRAIFQLTGVALFLVAAIAIIDVVVGSGGPGPPPPETQALAEAQSFLGKLDDKDYRSAFDSMADIFRQTFRLQDWLMASETYRTPLGKAAGRTYVESSAGQQPYGGRQYNCHRSA